ncbi:MAG TPA: M20 family metallopeptidase [Opitutaceae bacterium]|nr:M20 family metallopeptidase [Opitutaceae bacterium]
MTPHRYLEENIAELVELVRRFVSIDTVNPPGQHYDAMTALLVKEMEASGLQTRRYPVPASWVARTLPPEQHAFPRFNVLGKRRARGAGKTIHFNAHYDVVPVSGQWAHGSPFSGAEEAGWVYGRGTADMKGSIASVLMALRALQRSDVASRLNVEVSFTADEETDSTLGAGWLVKQAPIHPDFAVVMEGGDLNRVCCGHNGVVWLEVTVHGKAAHGSTPEKGINALEKMASLIQALQGCKKELEARSFVSPEGKRMVPTLNLGGEFSSGPGGKINTVPSLARFSIDRRVLAVETVASAERHLRAFLQSAARSIPQCRITIKKVAESHPCFTPPSHPLFAAMARCVTEVRREKAVFSVSTGFNDMHYFASELGIPTVGYGPGGQAHHAVDERARIKELLASAKIYASLLTSYEGG